MQITIIIPTLNEADELPATLQAIWERAGGEVPDVVVSDCGSRDDTVAIAKQWRVTSYVNSSLPHRAAAINAGARSASTKLLLFLDADTWPPPQYDIMIKEVMQLPFSAGGGFSLSFRSNNRWLQAISLFNHLRYKVTQRFFGDQGLFVGRSVFEKSGGLPCQPLLATAHFCEKIKKYGRLHLLKPSVQTSGRRFLDRGVGKTFLKDCSILLRDYLNRPLQHKGQTYWDYNRQQKEAKSVVDD